MNDEMRLRWPDKKREEGGGGASYLECRNDFFAGRGGGGDRGISRLRERAEDGGHATFGDGNHAAAKL
jgi:hypothetical protein